MAIADSVRFQSQTLFAAPPTHSSFFINHILIIAYPHLPAHIYKLPDNLFSISEPLPLRDLFLDSDLDVPLLGEGKTFNRVQKSIELYDGPILYYNHALYLKIPHNHHLLREDPFDLEALRDILKTQRDSVKIFSSIQLAPPLHPQKLKKMTSKEKNKTFLSKTSLLMEKYQHCITSHQEAEHSITAQKSFFIEV